MGDPADPLAAALAEVDAAAANLDATATPDQEQARAPGDLMVMKGDDVTVVAAEPPARQVHVSGFPVFLNDENRLNVPATLGNQTCLVDSNGIVVPLGPTGYTDLPLVPGLEYHARDIKTLLEEMKKEKQEDEPVTESFWNILTGETDEDKEKPEEEPEKEPEKEVVALSWSKLEPTGQLPLPRYNHTATIIDDVMYVFGGQVEGSTSNLLFTLALESKVWSRVETTGTVPAPRYGHTALAYGKKIVICGGVVRKSPTVDIFILDTETMEWSKPAVTGDVPCGRYGHTATLVGDKVYVIAGIAQEDEYLSDLYIFDLATNEWTCPDVGGAVPEGFAWHSAALVDEAILIFGGKRRMFMFVDEYIEDVFIFHLGTSEWLGPAEYVDADTITGRDQHVCAKISDTQLLFYGGETRWGDDISVILLDLDKKTWVKVVIGGQWPEARHGHSACVSGNRMIIFGGLAEGWTVGNVYTLSFASLVEGNKLDSGDTLGASALPPVDSGIDAAPGADATVVVAQKMEEREVPE